MKRRTRLIAGSFALVAMTFALAEAVWASTCAPAMEMHASDATVAEQVPSHDCMLAVLHDRERDDERASDNGEEHEPQCPLSSAAAQTCAGMASLPSHTAGVLAPWPDGATDVFFELARHDPLLKDALFHPPRA